MSAFLLLFDKTRRRSGADAHQIYRSGKVEILDDLCHHRLSSSFFKPAPALVAGGGSKNFQQDQNHTQSILHPARPLTSTEKVARMNHWPWMREWIMTTTTQAPLLSRSFDAALLKLDSPGKKDTFHTPGNRRREQGKRLAGFRGPWHPTQGQRPAPVKRPRCNSFREISVVAFSAMDYFWGFGSWLLAGLEIPGWTRTLQTGEKPGVESGSTRSQLHHTGTNPQVTIQKEQLGDGLAGTTFSPSLVSAQATSNAGEPSSRNSAFLVGSVNLVAGKPVVEFDLHAFQDLLDSASDTCFAGSTASLRSFSERTSVITLDPGKSTNWLRDVDVYAIGSDEASVVNFVAKLDTGADICVMAERVAARIGIDKIDKSDQPDIEGLARQVIKPIGRIDIEFHLPPDRQWYRGSFYVISDSIIHDKFDVLFSKGVIGQMSLLVLGPRLVGQTIQNKTHLDVNNVITQGSPRC